MHGHLNVKMLKCIKWKSFLRDMGKIGVQKSFTYVMQFWWIFVYVRAKTQTSTV